MIYQSCEPRTYAAGDIRSDDKREIARIARLWGLHVRVYRSVGSFSPIEEWHWSGHRWERVR